MFFWRNNNESLACAVRELIEVVKRFCGSTVELAARMKVAEMNIDTIETDIDNLKANLDTQFQAVNGGISDAAAHFTELKAELDDLKASGVVPQEVFERIDTKVKNVDGALTDSGQAAITALNALKVSDS